MNIFEFARMVQHDIEIVYNNGSGVFTATMRGVFLEGQNFYAYAEGVHSTTAMLDLCAQMSYATVRVRAEGSQLYILKTQAILLGDNCGEGA